MEGILTRDTNSNASRRTSLFLVLSDHVSGPSPVKEFLLHRLGNPDDIDFDEVKVKQLDGKSEGCSLVELCFTSFHKADRARYLLNNSNTNTSTKVLSYFKECEAVDEEIIRIQQRESDALNVAREIVETAQRAIEKHNGKMNTSMLSLKKAEEQLSKKINPTSAEFEMFSNEKLAIEDKLNELELQKHEFINYAQTMKKTILELHVHKRFESEIREVRKAFGVECSKLDHALPMYARRENVLKTVNESQVSIVIGETGSGKSTQLVQYLYQAGLAERGMIACTQPRKIAATSLATHVSSEMASRVGQEVGYQVGMQSKKTAMTKVLFMTDQVLLNACLRDNNLSAYSCIIIDEAHERSIFTDLLIGMLKECMTNRPELRVVITSATIDPDVFVSFFGGPHVCPVLTVSGRTFPVEVIWGNDNDSAFPDDYERKALNTAIKLHKDTRVAEGDILVFLTSQVEIERCCQKFESQFNQNSTCLPLHGKLKADEQQLVFAPNAPGKRKVVFATNSAETSITIPGIKFVVDTGVVKEMRYDPKRNMNSLDVVSVSQSSANQRKGRAGRTAPGICYRLYTEADFNTMNKTGCPEIMRVHLGQAMLKLMELKVNPMTFKFVESPSSEAMTTAYQTLIEVGAVANSKLTELGQWISKLPVDPLLGAMIKHGVDADVPVEVLIIAASCSQGGIFYRAGTKEEKNEADLRKVPFSHHGGDLLTVLKVYREWDKISENGKGVWCKENYINGKSVKGIRETVKEMLKILQKECGLKITYALKDSQVDAIVQKLLFRSYKSNISYYLGHEKAGYMTARKLQHVQIHPSSCLRTLAMQPSWVVFNQLLKTTDNFITNITPVSEEDIDNALKEKLIDIDIDDLKKRKVERVLQVPVGKHVFWKFVGPMHQNRREIESNIKAACNENVVVIEADKTREEISLYCVEEYKGGASSMLQDAIRPLCESLLLESKEEPIEQDQCNVRVLIGQGCGVIDVLMPHQYRSINIKEKDVCHYELTLEKVRTRLTQYGIVEMVTPFGNMKSNSIMWGKATFVNEADAIVAVKAINEDDECVFTVLPIMKHDGQDLRMNEYTIRMQWCRRPGKEVCYVYLENKEDLNTLVGADVDIGANGRFKIMRSKAQSDLTIRNLVPSVTEEEVKEALARSLGVTMEKGSKRFRVVIPRLDAPYSSNEMERVTKELSSEMLKFDQSNSFKVFVKEYKEKAVFITAFIKFQDPQKYSSVATKIGQSKVLMGGKAVDVTMEFEVSVFISKKIFDATKEDIDTYVKTMNQRKGSTVQIRVRKSGTNFAVIKAASTIDLAEMKLELDAIIQGDLLEIGGSIKNLHVLFMSSAKLKIQQIEKKSATIIAVNDHSRKVTIQGLKAKRRQAINLLEDYIAKTGSCVERRIDLKGVGNPPGLMKAVLTAYGLTLCKLQSTFNLLSADLHLRNNVITILGDEDAVVKAEEAIHEVRENLRNTKNESNAESDVPDCPVCLCPVDFSDHHRLEYCGHAYCQICLISMIEDAIKSRQFPLQCSADGCGKNLVIRDLNTQLNSGKVKQKDVVESALSCFVAKNNKDYKFCITPDCSMVYTVSTNGMVFHCPLCQTAICSTCHVPFHDELTCEMYKAAKSANIDHNTLAPWLRENPDDRKLCPKCGVGIEKTEGCNRMACAACQAHICWVCLEYFCDSGSCYGHLSEKHGGFF